VTGSVKCAVYSAYVAACGSLLCALVIVLMIGFRLLLITTDVWLSRWSNKYYGPDEGASYYVSFYAVFTFSGLVCVALANILFAWAGVRGGTRLHYSMLQRLLKAPVAFFDTTPLGRIINRFSSDVNSIDTGLQPIVQQFLALLIQMVGVLAVIAVVTVYFISECCLGRTELAPSFAVFSV
jgi:ABC-type multidrug transport system fused ATPase/permease subunit